MITHVGWKRAWREKCDPQRTSSWNWGVASGHRRRESEAMLAEAE